MSQPSQSALARQDWFWLLLVWAIAVGTLLLRYTMNGGDGPFFNDTDDAMRMVVVRDFLGGQNWYDTIQHRLNTPWGADIHWSRLIDLPLAALVFLSEFVVGPQNALVAAGIVWPMLLLGVLLYLSARVAFALVGRAGLLPALVLPILSPALLAEFNPGRVDHHNVIIVLTVAALLTALLALHRPLLAWLCGAIVATAMAIAVEALPAAIAAILAFGFAYVADPSRAANLRRFGLAFAGAMVLHMALARPPSRWLEAACDMISPVYVLAALAVGAAYLLVSILPPPRRALLRLLLLGALGLLAAGLVVLVYPQCLGGPYGPLNPWLQENWIGAIVEAKPWHESLFELPAYSISVAVPVLLAAVIALVALWREPGRRLSWLILLVFILCTALIMFAQVRGARLAVLPAIPAAAWLIVRARHAYLARPHLGPAALLIGSWLAFSGVIFAVLVNALLALVAPASQATATILSNSRACLAPQSFADLRGLPPQRIMAPIDLGSHILLETAHEVVAAPYHRNEAGLLDTFRFFSGTPEAAHAIARARGLTLLVTCDAMPELRGGARAEPGTMLNRLSIGDLPDWLTEFSVAGPLRIYTIAP